MVRTPRKRPYEPSGPAITVDAWTLKCLYNTSDYPDRIASGELVNLYEERGRRRHNGEQTVQAYYGSAGDGLVLVKLQWFELEDGTITRSGLKEPKWMFRDSFAYHLHGGDRLWQALRRDLTSLRYGSTDPWIVRSKKLYGDWRRFKCARFGPVEALWRRRWFTSPIYSASREVVAKTGRAWIRARKALKPLRSFVRRRLSGPRGLALALS